MSETPTNERTMYDSDDIITVQGFITPETILVKYKTSCCVIMKTGVAMFLFGLITGWFSADYVQITHPF